MFIDQQIKRGQRLGEADIVVNVVGKLAPDVIANVAASAGGTWGPIFSAMLGPVGAAIAAAYSIYSLVRLFQHWKLNQELKIAATAKAEDFVQSIWGTLEPNSPPTEDSVSKTIEECKLDEAQEMINFLARQMQEKAKNDPYFDRWAKDWGLKTLLLVQNKIDAYRGYCAPPAEPGQPPAPTPEPISCPPGFYLNGYGVCTPLSPPTLPPAIEPTTGAYIPLPQATVGRYGILGLMMLALAAIFFSNR